MLIAVMSDSHDRWDYLGKAVEIANDRGASQLLFAGDFMSPPGIGVIGRFAGQVTMVWGNNDGEKLGLTAKAKEAGNITIAGEQFEGTIGGKNIHMNHYPRAAELAAASGLFQIVIYGHTHVWHEEVVSENVLILNPGELQGNNGLVSFAFVEIDDSGKVSVEKVVLNN